MDARAWVFVASGVSVIVAVGCLAVGEDLAGGCFALAAVALRLGFALSGAKYRSSRSDSDAG